jgi:hypothetical protein
MGLLRGIQMGFDVNFNLLSNHLDGVKTWDGIEMKSIEEIKSWLPNEKQHKVAGNKDSKK